MAVTSVNPWTWQQGFGFSQGVSITGIERIVEVSGQCATGPDGAPQHAGDMRGQIELSMKNIATVLEASGLSLANVSRIRVFATDVGAALAAWDAVVGPLNAVGVWPASSLLGTTGLFSPDLMVEIEVTAVE